MKAERPKIPFFHHGRERTTQLRIQGQTFAVLFVILPFLFRSLMCFRAVVAGISRGRIVFMSEIVKNHRKVFRLIEKWSENRIVGAALG